MTVSDSRMAHLGYKFIITFISHLPNRARIASVIYALYVCYSLYGVNTYGGTVRRLYRTRPRDSIPQCEHFCPVRCPIPRPIRENQVQFSRIHCNSERNPGSTADMYIRTRDCNSGIPNPGIPDLFLNPEIPGLEPSNPGISGLTTSYISM
jgi:hypothetical protein